MATFYPNLIESMVDVSRIAAKPCMAQIPDDPSSAAIFPRFSWVNLPFLKEK
jgi:hypothetical protein